MKDDNFIQIHKLERAGDIQGFNMKKCEHDWVEYRQGRNRVTHCRKCMITKDVEEYMKKFETERRAKNK